SIPGYFRGHWWGCRILQPRLDLAGSRGHQQAMSESAQSKPKLSPLLKMAFDFGPLVLFFFANSYGGIFFSTAAFMVAVVVALATKYMMIGKIPIVPVVTAAIVIAFGALTLWLHDETFIKMKPTIIYSIFAAILFVGLATGRPLFE